ncbi:MAG: nuclear transport factor 2 family protein [Gemmatimonadota bacterium]
MRQSLSMLMLCAAGLSRPLAAQVTPPATAPAPAAAPAPTLPSVALPAALDRVLRDYERAWRASDAPALTALFAEDGFVMQGGRPPVRGRAGIQAAYTGRSGGALRLRPLAFSVADSVGFIIGAYGYEDSPGDVGKFTLTLHRGVGGRWVIFSDMDNPSQPPRRPG